MINLRYHVFSLVAVFAALAIGIVLGSTTVKGGLVANLRNNIERAESRIAEVESDNARLRQRDEQLDALEDEGAQLLVDELVGEPIVWVIAPDVRGGVAAGLQESFDSAGAVSVATISIDSSVTGDDGLTTIGAALESTSRDLSQLQRELGVDIGERLDRAAIFIETPAPPVVPTTDPDTTEPATTEPATTGPATTDVPGTDAPRRTTTSPPDTTGSTDAPGRPDETDAPDTTSVTTDPPEQTTSTTSTTVPVTVTGPRVDSMLRAQLGGLEDSGVIDLSDMSDQPLAPGQELRFVVVADQDAADDVSEVLVSFLDRLGSSEAPHVVVLSEGAIVPAEGEEEPESVVRLVRSSGRLRDVISTVDNVQDFPGWAATVLGVRNGIAGDIGHWGNQDGSESLLPAPVS